MTGATSPGAPEQTPGTAATTPATSAPAVASPTATATDRAAQLALPEMAPLSFFLGEWDVQVYDANTSVPLYRARTHARPALDGHVIQDDWNALDGAGPFEEHLRSFDITGDSYSFRMEHSYDGGATRTKISYLKATRRV